MSGPVTDSGIKADPPALGGAVEAWARSPRNQVGELEHNQRNNRMRSR